MATLREIVKKRVGPDGKEIACDSDPERWVDIKETQKTTYERGRGPAYQKTVYTHEPKSELREYDDEPKITFKNPADESQKIEYLKTKGLTHGTLKSYVKEAGRGPYYQKTIVHFENGEDNTTREIREQRVENPTGGDHIMVERIVKFSKETGRGPAYQKKVVAPANDEENIKASDGQCKVQ